MPEEVAAVVAFDPGSTCQAHDRRARLSRHAGRVSALAELDRIGRLYPGECGLRAPPPDELLACLKRWETFLHDRSLPPLVQVALAHYQFEAIHPFLDGNGRVGRLLITLLLVECGILPTPLLYLSAFFEATRRDYYNHLLGVSTRGDWPAWLEYFLNGVARQSEDALSRAERDRVYCAKAILSILEEPARLVGHTDRLE